MVCLWGQYRSKATCQIRNPSKPGRSLQQFATTRQSDLIKFMSLVIVWNCSSKRSNCSTSSVLSMYSPIIPSLGPNLFPTWHMFMAKLGGISAVSGSGPSMAAHPQVNVDWVTKLSLKVNWDLCPVWRTRFRHLTSLDSFYDVLFSVHAWHLPFIVYWKDFTRHCLWSIFVILLMKDAI